MATEGMKRLFWALNGPIETNIFVLEDAANPNGPREAYFRQTPGGTTWHPISQEPLTEPGVSSISVAIEPLDEWQRAWFACHEHAEPDNPNCVYREVDGLLDLVRCCGQDEPTDLAPLVVQASDKPYVTIHDFVTTLHPQLMSLRSNALAVMGMWHDRKFPEETKLMVLLKFKDRLRIEKEEEWFDRREPPTSILNDPLFAGGPPTLPMPIFRPL